MQGVHKKGQEEMIFDAIRQWGEDKGLTGPNGKATVKGQMAKLAEEMEELEHAVDMLRIADSYEYSDYMDEAADAIGDITVVLVLLAKLLELHYEDCVHGAYATISTRTGRMENGVFIKDEQQEKK
jgi:NTP pyrophosphatase (non-canonical NTP hydrolase)